MAARGLPIEIVAAFDRSADCLATYVENHPHVTPVRCDVSTFDFARWAAREQPIGRIDVVLGGIPCEQLSLARANNVASDTELAELRTLTEACLRIPDQVDADWYCYEDVVQLRNHLPPFTPWFEIDSGWYSAQRRRRLYVSNMPVPQLPAEAYYLAAGQLKAHLRPGPYRRSQRLAGRRPGRSSVYGSDQFYPWYPQSKAPTVINLGSRHDNYAATSCGAGWRQLEWQELATLQGFPNDYVFVGSPSSVTKQVGQAVQVDTGRAILQRLCEAALVESTPAKTRTE